MVDDMVCIFYCKKNMVLWWKLWLIVSHNHNIHFNKW